MILTQYKVDGTDDFENGEFSAERWSAPRLFLPEEIRDRLNSFKLPGRRIEELRLIGNSRLHTRDKLRPEVRRQSDRCAEINEPLLIGFEDGDAFEIDAPREAVFRMSMNHIPWYIDATNNPTNVDANTLFAPCIGQVITAVEVNTYEAGKAPLMGTPFEHSAELASNVTLRLENGMSLEISPHIDCCTVSCLNANGECEIIEVSKLKDALFNWEDLHIDGASGFAPEGNTLFFGRKGEQYVRHPCIMLFSNGNADSELYISEDHISALLISAELTAEGCVDIYGQYRFSYAEWYDILCKADELLDAGSFDELSRKVMSAAPNKKYMQNLMNASGVALWERRDMYREQISDLRRWSRLVMHYSDTMFLLGS